MILNKDDLQVLTKSELYRARSWCLAALCGQIPVEGIAIIDDFEVNLEIIEHELTRRIYSST